MSSHSVSITRAAFNWPPLRAVPTSPPWPDFLDAWCDWGNVRRATSLAVPGWAGGCGYDRDCDCALSALAQLAQILWVHASLCGRRLLHQASSLDRVIIASCQSTGGGRAESSARQQAGFRLLIGSWCGQSWEAWIAIRKRNEGKRGDGDCMTLATGSWVRTRLFCGARTKGVSRKSNIVTKYQAAQGTPLSAAPVRVGPSKPSTVMLKFVVLSCHRARVVWLATSTSGRNRSLSVGNLWLPLLKMQYQIRQFWSGYSRNITACGRRSRLSAPTISRHYKWKTKGGPVSPAVDWLTRKIIFPMNWRLGSWRGPLWSVQSCCTGTKVQRRFCNRQ